jgi:ParB-like chromosome segregation protein Spo0J
VSSIARLSPQLLTREEVSPELVHANPWNPNRQDERERRATRESIITYGFIDPVIVRRHPDQDGHYQVIDGEHRWLSAIDLGLQTIPLDVLEPCPDVVAKKLTIVLNETRGKADPQLLGALLAELAPELGDELALALPFSQVDIDGLLAQVGASMAQVEPQGQPQRTSDEWFTISARVPVDFQEVWQEAVDKVRGALDGSLKDDPRIQAGQVIEVLCAEYLAGA